MSVGLYVHNSRIKQAGGVPPLASRVAAQRTRATLVQIESLVSRSKVLLLGFVVVGFIEAGLEDIGKLIQQGIVLELL